jgi:23S rRNA pseudouridine2605 synthase
LDGAAREKLAVSGGRVRLDRALSKLGLASRAEARALIASGAVTVRGRPVSDPATPVVPESGGIAVEGRHVVPPRWRAVMFHKPRGVVTTRRDPDGRRTVFDVLGPDGDGLVAVGRLDMATTGLLLLTTDTQLANRLTDPANAFVRRYAVTVRGALTAESARRMEHGIDGMHARSVTVRKRSRRETHLIVELTEGKNREIRRLCEAVGHEVTRLKRTAFAGVELGDLQPGEWRAITRDALISAMRQAGAAATIGTPP